MASLDQDESVFWGPEFTIPVSLRNSEGLIRSEVPAIREDAVTDEQLSGRASHRAFQPQVTVPTRLAEGFDEGDTVVINGREHEIIDRVGDDAQTTFSISE